jgi:hypothetical protein
MATDKSVNYMEGVFMRQIYTITRVFRYCNSQDVALLYVYLFCPDDWPTEKEWETKLVSVFEFLLLTNTDKGHRVLLRHIWDGKDHDLSRSLFISSQRRS